MSATWTELDKALQDRASANHLVSYEWEKDIESIEAECERKGVPYVEGRKYDSNSRSRPSNYTQVRW